MTHFNLDYTIQRYYNERHHGKGPMDGVGETVKNMIFQHVKSKKETLMVLKILLSMQTK